MRTTKLKTKIRPSDVRQLVDDASHGKAKAITAIAAILRESLEGVKGQKAQQLVDRISQMENGPKVLEIALNHLKKSDHALPDLK